MSNIQRLTLISNPTNEFPKNANNSFKVRLPERLSLPGEGWHPLMHTSFRLLEPWMLTHLKQRRKMKGGTVFCKSTRMRNPWMDPSASQVNPEKWLMTMDRRRHAIKRTRR